MPNTNKRNSEHQHYTRARRNEQVDKNRQEYREESKVQIPRRRESRESLKGRRELSVLPLSNTPLYGFEDPETETNMDDHPFAELRDFSTSGERMSARSLENLASGILPPNAPYVETVENNLNRNLGAPRKEPIQIQNNIPIPNVEVNSRVNKPSVDANTMSLMRELIKDSQKEMMDELTNTFREALRVETQKIARQFSETSEKQRNVTNPPNYTIEEPPSYRLEYREPRQITNQTHPNQGHHGTSHSNPYQPPLSNNDFPSYNRSNDRPSQRNQYNFPNANSQPQQPEASAGYHHPNAGPRELPPQPNNGYNHHNVDRIQLDKWGFQFNGSNMSVDDFLFRIECKQATSTYTWHEVYCNLNNLLSDPAENWYWNFRKFNPNSDYNTFRLALTERYPSRDTDVDLWRKLINRKQQPDEAFDDFVDEVERIYYRMNDRPTEIQLISVIRDNVSSEISQYIGLARTNSLTGIKYIAREAEKLVEKLNTPASKSKFFKKNVNEVTVPDSCPNEEDHVFVEAFTAPKREYRIFKCKKCSQKFRVNEETNEEKRVYCYGCGKEGVIISKCPTCSENRKNSE